MASNTPNQHSFSQGELSPLMGGRTDLDLYSEGLAKLLNMFSDSRGPAKRRIGSRFSTYIAGVPSNPIAMRVEVLQKGNSFFVLAFAHIGLIVIRDIENPVPEVLSAPWTRDQIDDLYLIPLPSGNIVYICHPNVQPYKLEDNTSPANSHDFTVSGTFVVPTGITEMSVCIAGGGGGGGSVTGVPLGGGGGGGSGVVKEVISVTPTEVLDCVIGSGGTSEIDGTASVLTYLSGSTISNPGLAGESGLFGGYGGAGGSGGGAGGNAHNSGYNCSAICSGDATLGGSSGSTNGGGSGAGGFGDGTDGGLPGKRGIDAPANSGAGGSGAGDYDGFTSDVGGTGGSGFCSLTWNPLGSAFLLGPVTFTSPPLNWTGTNWPSAGTYYQSRLWLGGAPDSPETFLGSKSGFPEDFTIGSLAADALSFSIENQGGIEWMDATKNLLIGTTTGEYIVQSETGVIKPGDIEVLQQSAYGSASIQPVKIGDQIMYVTPDFRKVRAMNYEWQKNNWLSYDLTFTSEHITIGLIKKLTWLQHPNNQLWAVLKDGTMCCLTYERTNNVFGWHQHNSAGDILSLASGFNGTRSVLITASNRTPGDHHFEYLSDEYYFDSWKVSNFVTPYGAIFYAGNFTHLEGLTVQVLVDGAIHPDRVVGAESAPGAADQFPGRIYLEFGGSVAIAGLGYISELETLDVDGGSQTGSAVSHQKRRNEVFVKLLNSGIPIINGVRADDEFTSGAQPDNLFSGSISVSTLGWDTEANVNIKQDLPLPLTVLSIAGEIQKNKT